MKQIKGLAAEDFASQPSTYILDVRTPREFAGGALKNAVLISVDQLEQRAAELPKDLSTPILVYCAHGVRSAAAATFLEKLGYQNVTNLTGGLAGLHAQK